MTELLTALAPILLADAINPVLFGFMVVAAGTARPVLHSSMVLLGHTSAYFIAGITLANGIDAITDRLENPGDIDFLISLVVGVICLAMAIPSKKPAQRKTEEDGVKLTPISAFFWGAVVNFVGMPFALPYFAALSLILVAELSEVQTIAALLSYNLIYALPFLLVPILVAISGDASQAILQKVNDMLDKASAMLMPLILGGLGLFLVVDAVLYFRGLKPLF